MDDQTHLLVGSALGTTAPDPVTVRLECLRLAINTGNNAGREVATAKEFAAFVIGDAAEPESAALVS